VFGKVDTFWTYHPAPSSFMGAAQGCAQESEEVELVSEACFVHEG
jgi:hypothetical protein